MEINLETKVQYLKGVGPAIAQKLNRLGLETVEDLFWYFPRRYEDYTKIIKISELTNSRPDGASGLSTIRGDILSIANKKTRRRGFTVTEAIVMDDSGTIKVVWFNQPYLVKMLKPGSGVILHGRVSYDVYSQGLVMESPTRANRPKIVPIYGETVGISSFLIGKLVSITKSLVRGIEEWLPEELLCHPERQRRISGDSSVQPQNDKEKNNLKKNFDIGGLLPIQEAILNIHSPENSIRLKEAERRLAFDELFLISLRATLTNLELKQEKALPIEIDLDFLKGEIARLPFTLTADQKRALWAIIQDMKKETPMSRLLNGDVGSGKTIVATMAAALVAKNGQKTIIMAPTSILAVQHFETLCKVLGHQFKIGLVTKDRRELNYRLDGSGKADKKFSDSSFIIHNSDVIVGTQALIQEGVELNNVGLVVVDEQHRFGVKQRAALSKISSLNDQCSIDDQISNNKEIDTLKLNNLNDHCNLTLDNCQRMYPHFLSMTATPIPRTLHLALFGDLDISVIREKPLDRLPIITKIISESEREKAYDFIRSEIKNGRQAFVICPLIEGKGAGDKELGMGKQETETLDSKLSTLNLFEAERKSVKAEFAKLQKIFPEYKIEMLHGKMKAKEKDAIMARFATNDIKLLVSTSVVEVGVDIPNATVMLIEDAERYGLAQIHQFRGRVGRGKHQSHCFLFSNSSGTRSRSRLEALEKNNDGFKLAEIDLETRGPGAIFGAEQSGLLDLKMASISDINLIRQASEAAKRIALKIEKYPAIEKKLNEYISSKHLE